MNTSEFYERQHNMPTTPPRAAHPQRPTDARELAAFGDPSIQGAATTQAAPATGPARATRWLRPTELTDVGMRAIGRVIDRGFDAQARTMRAAIRGVGAAAKHVAPRRVPPTTSHRHDGMTL
ncbi:hypothetical protein ET495_10065 [Xylanimonas allomyrinae]|uniref:Uncharacterized protein n=1 Tax=Xylanimonas allomyrinae TaxID=2509459 RepID=A0A4P6EMB1_9MICO|nr:hypothetical protein [Xylanimonas allomyrinae]QAY63535.1 hypothetical protein ET495_10065 [Xylanimonas allomyrinae]